MTKSKIVDLDQLNDCDWLPTLIEKLKPKTAMLEMAEKVALNSVEYAKGTFVVISQNKRFVFVFVKIKNIIREEINTPLLHVIKYETEYFDSYAHSHKIEKINPIEHLFVQVEELLDYHPLDGYLEERNIYIRMKYLVLGKTES